jgi:hypothetical protein
MSTSNLRLCDHPQIETISAVWPCLGYDFRVPSGLFFSGTLQARDQHITELRLNAELLCPLREVGSLDHKSQRARGGLAAFFLPYLSKTLLYLNAVTVTNVSKN